LLLHCTAAATVANTHSLTLYACTALLLLLLVHCNNSTVREVKQEPQFVGGGIDPEAIALADARIQQCTDALEQAQQTLQGVQGEVNAVKEQKKRCDADIQNLRQQEVCKQLAANRLQTHLVSSHSTVNSLIIIKLCDYRL
jgi:peptidoglycan hydrolase CwlO-like protein